MSILTMTGFWNRPIAKGGRPLFLVGILFLSIVAFPTSSVSQNPLEKATGDENAETSAESEIDADLASPQATLTTFLKGIEAAQGSDDDLQWARVYKTLEIPDSAGDSRRDAALRLNQVLNRLGDIDPTLVAPDEAAVAEDRLERFELFPENPYEGAVQQFNTRLRKAGLDPPGSLVLARTPEIGWRFNAETIESINPLFGWLEERGVLSSKVETERPIADIVRSRVPDWAKQGFFLGLEVWQWAAISLVLILSVAAYLAGSLLVTALIGWVWKRFKSDPTPAERRRVARPLALIFGALVFITCLKLLGIIGTALAVFLLAGRLVLVAGATWTAWSFTNFLTELWMRHAEKTETTFDDMIVPMVRKTLKLIIVVWAIIYVAASIDILNFVTPLLAGFGLAGLAISFAAQDLIKNLFGGVTIFLDGPFQVGERIVFEGHDGVVENIGFRSTRLRTRDGHLVSVPNGAITNHCVENVGRRPSIRRDFRIGITYDTTPEKMRKATEAIHGILEEEEIRSKIHPQIEGDDFPPRVFFEDFGDSALVIRVIYWFADSDYWKFMEHADRINLRLLEVFNDMGIEFAFPTQTVHVTGKIESSAN